MVRVVPTAVLSRAVPRRAGEALPHSRQPLAANPGPEALGLVPPVSSLDKSTPSGPPELTDASPADLYELGLTTAAMAFHTAAIEALQACVARAPDHAAAWRKLAELLRLAGEDRQAEAADAAAVRASSAGNRWTRTTDEREHARLAEAEIGLRESLRGKAPEEAAAALRDNLVAKPVDAAALRLLAQLEAITGDQITSLRLLERALELCPDYAGVRENYAELLVERRAHAAAAIQTEWLLQHAPANPHYRHLHAYAMMHTGRLGVALEVMVGLLREKPNESRYWLPYAQALHFAGRRDECVQAYRKCLELDPDMGEAWWGLADLKGKHLTEADIAAMRARLDATAPDRDRRLYMLYALAQALEGAGDFPASFAAYEEGARLFHFINEERRKISSEPDCANDVAESSGRIRRMKAVFSGANLRTGLMQAPVAERQEIPIFIVGMPRAGSTLVEQILASHSLVEGTRELPLIGDITRDLALSRMLVVPDAYPECILDLTAAQLAALGSRYIDRSRDFRRSGRLWFIDKRPWNWLDAGLIHLILPQAKIIDIRREPMAACFAMFKQLLPNDAAFSYDLEGVGRYYNKYVAMMRHWQEVVPGRIHFVQYERLVEDAESEIRRMLHYCGLPFEERCLRFWETGRVVSTPSAEQVRRPIYRDALEQWRNFEPWLGPLKTALKEPVDV
jgi:tetratricopeptide (TPR) repeat protein